MKHQTIAIDTDLLLRQTHWLRGLAQGLLRDPNRADDALQQTLLTALERPPREMASESKLRGWLAKVLRNEVRSDARAEKRRAARHREVARAEALPSTQLPLEQVTLQRDLADEVLGLEAPYREVIVLRYFEGKTPAEIAEQLGMKSGAVRTRLSRGLDQLRARLDASRGGERRAWAIGLATLALRDTPRGAALPFMSGVFLAKAWWLGAAALFIVAGIWLALELSGGRRPEGIGGPGPEIAGVPPDSLPDLERQEEIGEPERQLAAAAGTRTPANVDVDAPDQAAEPAVPMIILTARVVDERGRPIDGAELTVMATAEGGPAAHSDHEGELRLEVPCAAIAHCSPQLCSYVVKAKGRASTSGRRFLRDPEVAFLGTITMGPGGGVRGRVVDGTGNPVAEATVDPVAPVNEWSQSIRERMRISGARRRGLPAVSDQDGTFRLEGLPVDEHSLAVRGDSTFYTVTQPVLVTAGATTDVGDIRLEPCGPEHLIEGIVLDSRGLPIDGERITLLDEEANRIIQRVFSDAEGRFQLLGETDTTYTVEAGRPGHDWLKVHVVTGTADVVLQYEAPRFFRARVFASDGGPLRHIVGMVETLEGRGIVDGFAESEEIDAIELLQPKEPFVARVGAYGYQYRKLGPFDPTAMPEQIVFELERAVGIEGRVVSNGTPVAGAWVELHGGLEGLARTPSEFYSYVRPQAFGHCETLEDGSFFLQIHPQMERYYRTDPFFVHAFASGLARSEVGPFSFTSAATFPELEIELRPGGSVTGRLISSAEFEPRGQTVVLSRGDGHDATMVVVDENGYCFENVPPGSYQLRTATEDQLASRSNGNLFSPWTGELPWNVEVFEGKETVFDLTVITPDVFRLTGRFTLDGQRPTGWTPGFRGGQLVQPPGVNGEFVAEAMLDGTARLTIASPRGELFASCFYMEFDLLIGENHWERDVATGSIELEGLDLPEPPDPSEIGEWQPSKMYCITWEGEDGLLWRGYLSSARDGRARLPQVPAGSLRLTLHFDPPRDALPIELQLAPGESKVVKLP